MLSIMIVFITKNHFKFFFMLMIMQVSGVVDLACIAQFNNKSYHIKKLPFNSESSDKNPVYYNGGIVFSSNRKNDLGIIYFDQKSGMRFSDLYFTKKDKDGKWLKPAKLEGVVNSKHNEGAATFMKDSAIICFTRGEISGQSQGQKKKLGIYKAEYRNGTWTWLEPFPYNSEKYHTGHPAFSPSGKIIIFASDMQGGFGGTDLYVSYKKSGEWSKPINLGSSINTKGNEIAPFIHESGRLFYATNGKSDGYGGYDIYWAEYFGLGGKQPWKNSHNVGRPFNSSGDDYGFISDIDYNEGFFTSNRNSENPDNDNIYEFQAAEQIFSACDTLASDQIELCKTFYEKGSLSTDSLPLIYEWKLGDGTKKRGLEVHHCYEKPGVYVVQLNVVDLLTEKVYFNEATYELKINKATTPYIKSPDSVWAGYEIIFDAGLSVMPACDIESYEWNMGDGTFKRGEKIRHSYNAEGVYDVKLAAKGTDSLGNACSQCIMKPIKVIDSEKTKKKSSKLDYSRLISTIAKPVYTIKDHEGHEYRIQIATSKKPLNVDSINFHSGGIKEYKDRGIYGYTMGSYDNLASSFPELEKIHEKGFKEAVVIAMKEGKVISGSDSSFYTNLPDYFVPVKVVRVQGKVTDKQGNPLPATIKWEELENKKFNGSVKCDPQTGAFSIDFTDGFFYGYHASLAGYYPVSNFLDLRGKNELTELNNDIVMIKVDSLIKTSESVRLNNIFFNYGEHKLQPESYPELKRIAKVIRSKDSVQVQIAGHTDSIGSKKENRNLSIKRARSVKEHLVSLGCREDKLITKGYGESKPLVSNKSERGRRINRRVTLKFIDDKQK